MKQQFANIDALVSWMVKNGDRKQSYYYSLDINTCEMEVSSNRINESINKIVRHPEAIRKYKKWRTHIAEAFGGFVCKASVIELLGKSLADKIHWDALADNPHYRCSSPMKLYLANRIRAIIDWLGIEVGVDQMIEVVNMTSDGLTKGDPIPLKKGWYTGIWSSPSEKQKISTTIN